MRPWFIQLTYCNDFAQSAVSKKDIPIAELLRNFYSRALIIPFLKGIDWRKDFLEVLELLETMETIENLPFRHIPLKSDTLIINFTKNW